MAQAVGSRSRRRAESGRSAGSALSLSNVSHGFGETSVLEDVTLTVERGETLAVIGPSGTGKTTLLRLLALFDPPDEGEVRLGGTDLWSLSSEERHEARRRVGMVFQDPTLFDSTVQRNVSYGLRVRQRWRERLQRWMGGWVGGWVEGWMGRWAGGRLDGGMGGSVGQRVGGGTTASAVQDSLETVGLAAAAERPAGSLSGGEAQRVAFARALAPGPEFLFLDEPTSDLDPRNTAVIERAIATARDDGLGVVVATHDMQQAERVADRVAVLLDGRLIEIGPTARVFSAPTDRRTQRFIDGELVY